MGQRKMTERKRVLDENFDEEGGPHHTGSTVHMLILSLDYPGTGHELTCTDDGINMEMLAKECGVNDIVHLVNNECHFENVKDQMNAVMDRCQEGDYFVFNYAGHGSEVPDVDGDEADGKDECLCLVTPDGGLSKSGFMTDDEFAEIVTSKLAGTGVKVLIMCDCCHSGTMADFADEEWKDIEAISMSGCKDDQTSGDTGSGGIWTHSLLLAIQQLQEDGNNDYAVGQVYNMQLEKDDSIFDSAQDINAHWSPKLDGLEHMAWPFVPQNKFVAPYRG